MDAEHDLKHESEVPRRPHGFWPSLWWLIRIGPRFPFVWFIRAYRKVISPLYGQVCRYYPSCSMYGLEAFEIHGVLKGMVLTGWRILRCNPFSHGGVDHVPGSARQARSETMRF
ncbi:membrane protein insertion efficiency factor YidD [Brevibacterium sp.]|uniref:membrane protein insertion efficiency factor YidD n=1 Tax=Brevibacterium sp. TaxID=1701 RepID=UPI002811FCD7|nr:membrane protein insertion efficiency factor YidD [Brevibacterium sp.]